MCEPRLGCRCLPHALLFAANAGLFFFLLVISENDPFDQGIYGNCLASMTTKPDKTQVENMRALGAGNLTCHSNK